MGKDQLTFPGLLNMNDTRPNDHRSERCKLCRDYFTPREMSTVKPKCCVSCANKPKGRYYKDDPTYQRGLNLANR